jgi:hypothetical protein|uniref:C2 domain-containing protein n=1 Tax=Eutreptiella gymnastica TaxID=73025 RepID=A0A7S4CWK1_9EUGL|mmetsp:Transcript_83518/g.139414  ORF Transcript_83518/g.139414 Transcript_83518/m.139414 type:complete len:294 (-) Transcript_83518:1398-2279(-)
MPKILLVKVCEGADLLSQNCFVALSLTSHQYHHTSTECGRRPKWNQTFEFLPHEACQIIVTVHESTEHPTRGAALCGQGILWLDDIQLLDILGGEEQSHWVDLVLEGKHAGKVRLAMSHKVVDKLSPYHKHLKENDHDLSLREPNFAAGGAHMSSKVSHPSGSQEDREIAALQKHLNELKKTEDEMNHFFRNHNGDLAEELEKLRYPRRSSSRGKPKEAEWTRIDYEPQPVFVQQERPPPRPRSDVPQFSWKLSKPKHEGTREMAYLNPREYQTKEKRRHYDAPRQFYNYSGR